MGLTEALGAGNRPFEDEKHGSVQGQSVEESDFSFFAPYAPVRSLPIRGLG
jgi:hypothetical protein